MISNDYCISLMGKNQFRKDKMVTTTYFPKIRLMFIAPVFISLFCSCLATGQMNNLADSLFAELKHMDKKKSIYLLQKIGQVYMNQNKHDSAIYYINESIKIANKTTDNEAIVKGTILKGKSYCMTGFYEAALGEHFIILKNYNIKSKKLHADLLLSIAYIYNQSNQVKSGIHYALNALSTYTKLGLKPKIAESYNVLGYIFEKESEIETGGKKALLQDSAFKYYKYAYNMATENNLKEYIALSSENIASIYEDLGQDENSPEKKTELFITSRNYYKKAYKINKACNNMFYLVNNLNDIGDTYQKIGKYDSALLYYDRNLALAQKHGFNSCIIYALDDLSETYYAKGDFKRAYEIENRSENLVKHQYKKDNIVALNRLMVMYETEKKEFEIKKQHKNRIILLLVIALIFSLMVFTLLAFRQSLLAKKLLSDKNFQLEKLIATKNRFFSIIAHDLKSPFNSILGLSRLLIEYRSSYDIEEYHRTVNLIHDSATSGFSLLENLLDWARMQTGEISFNPKKLDLKTIVMNNISLFEHIAREKKIVLSYNSPEELKVTADEQMIHTILRNLISNAIKFTPKGGSVEIKSLQENDTVTLSVSDTGIGIKPENIKRLFKIDENFSTAGTENEKGTGLGLILCKEFTDRHNGKIIVESKVLRGTKISIKLPA